MKGIAVLSLITATGILAQSSATITGRLLDPAGAAVEGARVRIGNALRGFEAETVSIEGGAFRFANLPLQTYEIAVDAEGMAPERRTVAANVAGTVSVELRLSLASAAQTVSVSDAAPTLVDPDRTGSYAQMNRAEIERLTMAGARGLETILASFPGFAQNANGAIHPRGAHNQMTFVIDGMPVSDQLTGAFANAIDPNSIQTVELYTGNIPAEFGSKVSAVANITTRSGLGGGRPLAGGVTLNGAGFDTLSHVSNIAGERGRFGYSAMVNSMETHRYLDAVSLDNLHNGGNAHRGYARVDFQATARDTLRLNVAAGRSSFELANLRSQHAAGMRQRQDLDDHSWSAGWLRSISAATSYETVTSLRSAGARLLPSPGDTPVTVFQDRGQSTFTTSHRINHVRGAHQFRAGADYQRFPLHERFTLRLTDWPDAPGHLQPFASRPFVFDKRAAGSLVSGWMQDQIRWGRFQFSLGLRHDTYRFLSRGNQFQPRLGMSFHLRETGTVFRASYNRTYQTPPNENLLVSSSPESAVLVDPAVRATLGGAFATIRPERQNFFEVGFQQSLGNRVSVQGAFYHKNAQDQQDNNSFFNTPIIFPTSLARIRVNGVEGRVVVPKYRGFSGTLSLTHARAISTPPFTGGLFIGDEAVALLSAGPFVIDHDQRLSLHGVLHWTHRRGLFSTFTSRYDSGLVINPSDPDEVAADPDYADLLPYIRLGSTPARAMPRTVSDIAAGYRHSSGDRARWEAALQATNIFDRTAVYTFQSLFAGTRLVQPRTLGVRLKFWF